ncbi:2-hydroxyacid dehydrogenase [Xanthobacteraceae bacterium Astr-EGSB]|uniref:2-hydroxyacid dehydrogenase n=1 Tax=Astrobacterium formosum TaxID=3069710 RepID=UPI0027B39647|nr:2-hydroxyacid dehydrogenase [Xanthobacteraceae bacterium Astr-EGSB]
METIALVGPYGADVLPLVEKKVGGRMRVKSVPTEADFPELGDVEYAILRVLKMNAATIGAMPRLKLIQRWGVGFEKVDIEAAGKRGVPVAVAPGGNATPVSELAVLLMLGVYRNIIPLHDGICGGRWEKEKYIDNSFVIRGKTVGLVGCGAIGIQVVQKIKAFGAEVIYYDVVRLPPEEEAKLGLRHVGLDELLAQADIVSLHLPLKDATRRLIDERAIGLMKPTAILINTARGEIVDSAALATALRSGRLRGAGLDVFDSEPLAMDSPLRGLPNVVFTPHTGGNTSDVNGDMVEICVDNIIAVSEGRTLPARVVVNSQFLPK